MCFHKERRHLRPVLEYFWFGSDFLKYIVPHSAMHSSYSQMVVGQEGWAQVGEQAQEQEQVLGLALVLAQVLGLEQAQVLEQAQGQAEENYMPVSL